MRLLELECSWGEKENKRRGDRDRTGHLCGGEKQEKEMCMDEKEMKERKII